MTRVYLYNIDVFDGFVFDCGVFNKNKWLLNWILFIRYILISVSNCHCYMYFILPVAVY